MGAVGLTQASEHHEMDLQRGILISSSTGPSMVRWQTLPCDAGGQEAAVSSIVAPALATEN